MTDQPQHFTPDGDEALQQARDLLLAAGWTVPLPPRSQEQANRDASVLKRIVRGAVASVVPACQGWIEDEDLDLIATAAARAINRGGWRR